MRDPGDELRELESQSLRRRLRRLDSPQGNRIELGETGACLNFSSNDYLGLADDAELKETYAGNVWRWGAGSGASRLVCGTMSPHLDLEDFLASLKRSEAALAFSSGFATATGTLSALCGKGDVVILDKLCHASLIDGARLSGATMRVFPHNDLDRLDHLLQWARDETGTEARTIVVTESVFSMDGDRAPLPEIVELKERHHAWLLLDEAHAFGVIGPEGRGLAAEFGLESLVDLQMGTLSKAVGLSGGYVCASRDVVDLLINRARTFIYSTAPPPALAATAIEALEIIRGERGDELRRKLHSNVSRLDEGAESAIVPVVVGENEEAIAMSERLRQKGFLVPAIRYPTVPRGTARLRVTLSAAHRGEDVEALKNAIRA